MYIFVIRWILGFFSEGLILCLGGFRGVSGIRVGGWVGGVLRVVVMDLFGSF